MEEKIQFTFSLGLNHKKTLKPVMSPDQACKVARNIITHYAGGGTIYLADGFYTHKDGRITLEKTVRIEILEINQETAAKIVAKLKDTFYQESVGVKRETVLSGWL